MIPLAEDQIPTMTANTHQYCEKDDFYHSPKNTSDGSGDFKHI